MYDSFREPMNTDLHLSNLPQSRAQSEAAPCAEASRRQITNRLKYWAKSLYIVTWLTSFWQRFFVVFLMILGLSTLTVLTSCLRTESAKSQAWRSGWSSRTFCAVFLMITDFLQFVRIHSDIHIHNLLRTSFFTQSSWWFQVSLLWLNSRRARVRGRTLRDERDEETSWINRLLNSVVRGVNWLLEVGSVGASEGGDWRRISRSFRGWRNSMHLNGHLRERSNWSFRCSHPHNASELRSWKKKSTLRWPLPHNTVETCLGSHHFANLHEFLHPRKLRLILLQVTN